MNHDNNEPRFHFGYQYRVLTLVAVVPSPIPRVEQREPNKVYLSDYQTPELMWDDGENTFSPTFLNMRLNQLAADGWRVVGMPAQPPVNQIVLEKRVD